MPLSDRSLAGLRGAIAAVVLAALLYWLAADDRPGVLGMLQRSLAFLFVVPSIEERGR